MSFHTQDLIDHLDRGRRAAEVRFTAAEAKALLDVTDGHFTCPLIRGAVVKLRVIAESAPPQDLAGPPRAATEPMDMASFQD